jgi:hypothetical protein
MSAITTTQAPAQTGDHIHVPLWAFAVMIVSLAAGYVLFQENGWVVQNWMTVHELFHDARHALGVPCH